MKKNLKNHEKTNKDKDLHKHAHAHTHTHTHTQTHSHPQSLTCLAHSPSGLVSMVTTAGMVSLAEMEGWRDGKRERGREREKEKERECGGTDTC